MYYYTDRLTTNHVLTSIDRDVIRKVVRTVLDLGISSNEDSTVNVDLDTIADGDNNTLQISVYRSWTNRDYDDVRITITVSPYMTAATYEGDFRLLAGEDGVEICELYSHLLKTEHYYKVNFNDKPADMFSYMNHENYSVDSAIRTYPSAVFEKLVDASDYAKTILGVDDITEQFLAVSKKYVSIAGDTVHITSASIR